MIVCVFYNKECPSQGTCVECNWLHTAVRVLGTVCSKHGDERSDKLQVVEEQISSGITVFGRIMASVSVVFAELTRLKQKPNAKAYLLDALAFVCSLIHFGLSSDDEKAMIVESEQSIPVQKYSDLQKSLMVQTVIASLGKFSIDENSCRTLAPEEEQSSLIRLLRKLF